MALRELFRRRASPGDQGSSEDPSVLLPVKGHLLLPARTARWQPGDRGPTSPVRSCAHLGPRTLQGGTSAQKRPRGVTAWPLRRRGRCDVSSGTAALCLGHGHLRAPRASALRAQPPEEGTTNAGRGRSSLTARLRVSLHSLSPCREEKRADGMPLKSAICEVRPQGRGQATAQPSHHFPSVTARALPSEPPGHGTGLPWS